MDDFSLKITYYGQCCFLIEANGLRIVTDPYLSYGVDEKNAASSVPWHRNYPPLCSLIELDPDLIIISHAHDDHLDPITLKQYLESNGSAPIMLPAPIADIAKDIGFRKVYQARAEHMSLFKNASIMPIACAHTSLDMDDKGRFYNLSYFLDFGDSCVFFGGDMSLYDGLSERIILENCSVLLLPCNGRDQERTKAGIIGNITAEEAAVLAKETDVLFIPCHHDLYDCNGRSVSEIEDCARKEGAKLCILKPGGSYVLKEEDDS